MLFQFETWEFILQILFLSTSTEENRESEFDRMDNFKEIKSKFLTYQQFWQKLNKNQLLNEILNMKQNEHLGCKYVVDIISSGFVVFDTSSDSNRLWKRFCSSKKL